MRIKKIQLKNGYKRFHDLTIDLGDNPKRIVALVGPNGCGKSSVLDGLLFRGSQHHGQIGDKRPKDANYHSMNLNHSLNYRSVSIEFVEGDFNTVLDRKSEVNKQMTIFSFRSPYRYNGDLKVNESRATPEIRLNSYGATSASDVDDKMIENYRRLNIKFNRYLKDNPNTATYESARQKIIGDLNASLGNCLDLEVSSIGDIEAGQGTLYFTKPDHPSEFEFNVLSSGEKEVVDILLDLYLRQEEYDDTVFLIDEPELHLNTSIQRNLLLEINKLVGQNCQIWVATHSIGFLRALQSDLREECQIIQFESGINWASSTQVLHPIKKTRAKWKEVFETALDDLTGLVSPNRLIYCEGRDMPGRGGEERGLDAKVFNNIFSEKHHDTLFISSGGNTELDQRSEVAIAILTKVFSDIEIWVLKDRDISSGRPNTEQDRQIYLQNNHLTHRVLRRWEIENYLYDKEVLKAYCDANELPFDEKGYDNSVTDIDNQDVKELTNKIKNLCSITTSINAERFKLTLSEYIAEGMNVYSELEECIFERK